MARIDGNGDGAISRAEAEAHPRLKERFAEIDGDRNGTLTREEMKAYRERQRASGNAPRR